ncbi:maltose operon transcriptional repressor [Streptococcus pneumoniae]|nr:maltose operon transcriptional repressor [Streptococcus pneumoniae]
MLSFPTDSLLAEGVCNYIAKHQLDVPVLSFDSVNPKLNLAAYVDINSLELGRVSLETILQIINDNKNNKQICYRQLIAHKIIEK